MARPKGENSCLIKSLSNLINILTGFDLFCLKPHKSIFRGFIQRWMEPLILDNFYGATEANGKCHSQ
jgi:hypothetical protein